MASISVSEDDFSVLATAALDAKARGSFEDAEKLDKLARKTSAAITNSKYPHRLPGMPDVPGIKWTDVKSILSY